MEALRNSKSNEGRPKSLDLKTSGFRIPRSLGDTILNHTFFYGVLGISNEPMYFSNAKHLDSYIDLMSEDTELVAIDMLPPNVSLKRTFYDRHEHHTLINGEMDSLIIGSSSPVGKKIVSMADTSNNPIPSIYIINSKTFSKSLNNSDFTENERSVKHYAVGKKNPLEISFYNLKLG